MKLLHLLFVCGLLTLAMTSQAASQMEISHGGLGFLFPDHNSFVNPGQFAEDKGTAIQAEYTVQQPSGGGSLDQTFIPSVVYGGMDWGIGVFGQRAGTDLLSGTDKTDTIGAGVGVGLFKDRLTIGVDASRDIDTNQTNDGNVGATLTWNGMKREGFTLGGGFNTTINQVGGDTRTATAAVGWGFEMTKVEAIATFNDLNNLSDWKMGGAITFEGKVLYFSALYDYVMLTNASEGAARLGVVFGRFDISALVKDTFSSGNNPEYGGTLRVAF